VQLPAPPSRRNYESGDGLTHCFGPAAPPATQRWGFGSASILVAARLMVGESPFAGLSPIELHSYPSRVPRPVSGPEQRPRQRTSSVIRRSSARIGTRSRAPVRGLQLLRASGASDRYQATRNESATAAAPSCRSRKVHLHVFGVGKAGRLKNRNGEQRRDEATRLRSQGKSWRKIAQTLGLPMSTVIRACSENPLPR
jgi:hypothetical protein